MTERKPQKTLRVKRNMSIDATVAKQLAMASRKLKIPMGRLVDLAIREYLKIIKETGQMPV